MICRSSQIAPPESLHVSLVAKALYHHAANYVVIKKSYKMATTLIRVLHHQYS